MFRKIVLVILICILLLCIESYRERKSFRIRTYHVKIKKKGLLPEPVKIVFLSDLHGNQFGEANNKLLQAIRKEMPDIIISGGDMIVRKKKETIHTAVSLLNQLKEIAPVYCANGNHEQKVKELPEKYPVNYDELKRRLDTNIVYLENDSVSVNVRGALLRISGFELPMKCYTHFKNVPLKQEEIRERIRDAESDRIEILLAHNPVYMKEYVKWGADLVLSGHLHGGIIRLPVIGGIITPQAKLFPKYSGDLYELQQCTAIVSRGLGTHTVNLRFLNQSEIVSIILE